MATGSQADLLNRLQRLTPNGWFNQGMVPIRDAVYTGVAKTFSFIYALIAYLTLQTRIATASDGFLDLIATDFFGAQLPRNSGEADGAYRLRIQANLYLEKATRPSLTKLLTNLTGNAPLIVEPTRPADTGGYGGGCGYGSGGAYGSLLLPLQAFVTVYLTPVSGSPLANAIPYGEVTSGSGYLGAGGYGVGAFEYADLSYLGLPNAAAIYAAIASNLPECAIAWVKIITT